MAPQPIYDPPHVQLGRLVVDAQARGLTFEEFWDEAVRPNKTWVMTTAKAPPVGAVKWPTDRTDRESWKAAIMATKEGWRRVYDGEQATSQETALGLLAPVWDVMAARPPQDEGEGIERRPALSSAA